MNNEKCAICGDAATVNDGIVGMYLCDETACLDRAWGIAFGDGAA